MPPKKKKSPSIGQLKKRAWSLFSELVRRFYSDHRGMVKCVTCQKVMPWKYAQAGHFVPKSRGNAVYFEWRNVHPQCPGCNLFSVQSATIAYHLYVEKMYGRDEVLRLLALAGERRSLRKGDYLGMIEFYNLCLREVR